MEPVLEQRLDSIEKKVNAMYNSLASVDAAAFLALYRLSFNDPLTRPNSLKDAAEKVTPMIQKMRELIDESLRNEEKSSSN